MADLELYLNGKKADISQDTQILFSCSADDLSNPTITSVPYSQQVTLPATGRNKAIFGNSERLDTIADVRTFDATKRNPFELKQGGELVQSGYYKIDSYDLISGGYTITLYGGLGALLYDLTYKANGEKMTIYDALHPIYADSVLTFKINAKAVHDAWQVLATDAGENYDRWSIINFAPCYEGTPSGFDAKKMVINPVTCGQPSQQTDGGVTYAAKNGLSVATFGENLTGYDTKEFRSYLLRPVVQVGELMYNIMNLARERGYSLNIGTNTAGIDTTAWLTLPLLNENGAASKETTTITLNGGTQNYSTGRLAPTPTNIPAAAEGAIATYTFKFSTGRFTASSSTGTRLELYQVNPTTEAYEYSAFCIQLVGYDAGGAIIERGGVHMIWDTRPHSFTAQEAFDIATKNLIGGTIAQVYPAYVRKSGSYCYLDISNMELSLYSTAAAKVGIVCEWIGFKWSATAGLMASTRSYASVVWQQSTATAAGTQRYATNHQINGGTCNVVIEHSAYRSGVTITPQMLFRGTDTPARYLLAFMRMYGLEFAQLDTTGKAFDILPRRTFYTGAEVDINARVDLSRGLTKRPQSADKRFYDFENTPAGGAWETEYKEKYGKVYGGHSFNTGYAFNSDRANVYADSALKGCAVVLEQKPTYCAIDDGGHPIPAPFIYGGKYTLYAADESSKDFELVTPSSYADIWYFNSDFEGYDIDGAEKPQFHNAQGAPVDGSNVVLTFCGVTNEYVDLDFMITDDNPDAIALNKGVPCWDNSLISGYYRTADDVPIFKRVDNNGESLDFGIPAEYNAPYDIGGEGVFNKYHRKFYADRYATDAHVITAYIDLGLAAPVSDALRKFYKFGGQLYAISAVYDYDVTRRERFTKCDLIRITDKTNYRS